MGRPAQPTKGFGAALRRLRHGRSLTVEQLAEVAGLSAGYISKLENNRAAAPRLETIVAIAEALDVDADVLLAASDDMPLNIRRAYQQTPAAFEVLASMTEVQRRRFAAENRTDEIDARERELRRLKRRLMR